MRVKTYPNNRIKRHARVRATVSGSTARPRLAVFRSSEHIYAQIIDDTRGVTLAAASDVKITDTKTKTERAREVGQMVAQAAKSAKISRVAFDRGGFAYHGRVRALAEAARAAGLEF